MYHVERLLDFSQASSLSADWDRLAHGIPFRSWNWLETWWRHYGTAGTNPRELYTLMVRDPSGAIVGIAPWYLESSWRRGRVIGFLGCGGVCSEYLTLLCEPGHEKAVTAALAEWLNNASRHGSARTPGGPNNSWDLIHLETVDARDMIVASLVQRLDAAGTTVHCRPGVNRWRLSLPRTWDRYMSMLSKCHRKQIRRLESRLGNAHDTCLIHVKRAEQIGPVLDWLADWQRQRCAERGERTCFDDPRFMAFHREIAQRLLYSGQLQMSWVEVNGRPVAVEYDLQGNNVVYAYQGAIEPTALDLEPGRYLMAATLRRLVHEGCRTYDLLRGDEPYKRAWRAVRRISVDVRIVPATLPARARNLAWTLKSGLKDAVKQGLKPAIARGAWPFERLASRLDRPRRAKRSVPNYDKNVALLPLLPTPSIPLNVVQADLTTGDCPSFVGD